ncbi:hypothetical protein SLEP1_g18785 [Rubroshorea leprosula]|uniref:Uncharacterized protein n=1 Tax=Rubroshorea leprosula TaxID=152421 RepID=A0AAV5J266_9ROSI|nr:hypothetical protein SLEP1_g18785 [Rubroshorea leprosula]
MLMILLAIMSALTFMHNAKDAYTVESGASQVISSKKLASGKRKSIAKPSKNEVHKFGASLASKQIKVNTSTPHKAKMPKENEEKTRVCIDELSLHSQYKLSIIVDLTKIIILSFKAIEAKNVEVLMQNMDEASAKNMDEASAKNIEEALAKPGVHRKIITGEADEPSLLDNILGLIDDIFDWNDFASFVAKVQQKRTKESVASPWKSTMVATNEDKGKKVADEPNPKSSNDSDKKVALEKGVPYLVVASKDSIPSKDEINVDEPTMSISKKAVSCGKIMSEDEPFSVLAKLSDIDNMHNKAKKVITKDAFINLYVAVRHMEVTPFVEMDEEFFHLCKDAIDDAKSINFEVGAIQANEGVPWQRQIQHG